MSEDFTLTYIDCKEKCKLCISINEVIGLNENFKPFIYIMMFGKLSLNKISHRQIEYTFSDKDIFLDHLSQSNLKQDFQRFHSVCQISDSEYDSLIQLIRVKILAIINRLEKEEKEEKDKKEKEEKDKKEKEEKDKKEKETMSKLIII